MKTVGSFLLALLLSIIVSQIVAQQLAIYFGTREEFILVIVLLFVFAFVSMAVLSVAFVARPGTAPLLIAAAIAFGLALLPIVTITLVGVASSGWTRPSNPDLQIITELLFPALLVVLVQWALIRRRRVKGLA